MNLALHWLAETTLSLSLVVAMLLVVRRPVARRLGAQTAYRLWMLVPVHIVAVSGMPASLGQYRLELAPVSVGSYPLGPSATEATSPIVWLIGLAWLTGVIVFASRLVMAAWAAHRLSAEGQPVPPGLNAVLSDTRLDPHRVRVSPALESPVVAGLFAPVLLLPAQFLRGCDRQTARLILAHEICHMRRRDNLATLVASLCHAVFWFNPLNHAAYRAFRADQELSCDARVLKARGNGERKAYGRALVKSAAANGPAAVTSTWQDRNHLRERIMMLHSHRHSPKRSIAGVAGVVSLAAASAMLSVNAFAIDRAGDGKNTLDRGPVLVEHAPPEYPADAAADKVEGRVVLQFTVDTEGRVRDVVVVKSQPDTRFDEAAVAALSSWRFEPARKDGKAVPVQARQAIEFEMD